MMRMAVAQRARRPSRFDALGQRFRDLARNLDEELRCCAERPVLQCHDTDRAARDRDLDRQFFYEWMWLGQPQPEVRENSEIATRLQKIGAQLKGRCDHGRTREIEPGGAKDLQDVRAEPAVRGRQRPWLILQLSK